MALSKETLEATEYAKSQLMTSNLDDEVKKQLYNLLTVSTMATNGISVDEKIQKITECIHDLAILQMTFLNTVDKKIELANKEQCKSCKAMQHASESEARKRREEIIASWKAANGYKDDADDEEEQSSKGWIEFAKKLLLKPYAWIFGSLLVISPHSVDIIKVMIEAFTAK